MQLLNIPVSAVIKGSVSEVFEGSGVAWSKFWKNRLVKENLGVQ